MLGGQEGAGLWLRTCDVCYLRREANGLPHLPTSDRDTDPDVLRKIYLCLDVLIDSTTLNRSHVFHDTVFIT